VLHNATSELSTLTMAVTKGHRLQ